MTMSEQDAELQGALEQCREAAERGFKLAQKNVKEMARAVEAASVQLQDAMQELDGLEVRNAEALGEVRDQLQKVMVDLEQLQRLSVAELKERKKHLEHFNVSLFGRTMAGKSTLMEILIRGDGSRIGKGAQRTTRDVRTYEWRGLHVTDVPGVAAFEGKDDENVAFEAASKADLVLFLITDDSPQPSEAECLARVRLLGKPVLGICNVKVATEEPDDLKLFLMDADAPFDKARLAEIRREFLSMADQYLTGLRIPFVYIHAHCRFLADRPHMRSQRSQLLKASRFSLFERELVRAVTGTGRFMRLKTFIDASLVPMMALSDQLLEFRAANSATGRVLNDKKRQVSDWIEGFRKESEQGIERFVDGTAAKLMEEIPGFAEDHYADANAGRAWEKLIKTHAIERKAKQRMEKILSQANGAMEEFLREISAELKLVSSIKADHIKMSGISNTKSWGRWAVGGLLAIAGFAAGGFLVAIGVGVVGFALNWLVDRFFESRESKARKARAQLEEKLERHVEKMRRQLRKEMLDWFYGDLLKPHAYGLRSDLQAMVTALFALADTQRDLAAVLMERQLDMNRQLIREALDFLGLAEWEKKVAKVARIPGFGVALLIEPGTRFPDQFRSGLEKLLGERLIFVIDNGRPKSVFSQLLRKSVEGDLRISIEERIQVAHVPLELLSEEGRSLACLGQQLTRLHVMP